MCSHLEQQGRQEEQQKRAVVESQGLEQPAVIIFQSQAHRIEPEPQRDRAIDQPRRSDHHRQRQTQPVCDRRGDGHEREHHADRGQGKDQ
jgi:hypothetical protein